MDDDEEMLQLSVRGLKRPLEDRALFHAVSDINSAWDILDKVHLDMIIADFELPDEEDKTSLPFLDELLKRYPDVYIIIFSSNLVSDIEQKLSKYPKLNELYESGKLFIYRKTETSPQELSNIVAELIVAPRQTIAAANRAVQTHL